jgi:hypothetical protein
MRSQLTKISPLSGGEEEVGKAIVNAAFKVHSRLGPGSLEKIYEVCLFKDRLSLGVFVAKCN